MFLSLFSSLILSLPVYASVTVAPFFSVFFSVVPFFPLVSVNVACSFEGLELVTNQLKGSGIEPNDFN